MQRDVAIIGAGYVGVPLAQVFADAGRSVLLVDDDPERIAAAIARAKMPTERPVLYGDGHASERIATVLSGTMARCAT